MGEEQSAPSADDSAAPAAATRQNIVSTKVRHNADGSASSKVGIIRDSGALLSLVGVMFHVDPEYWGILLTEQHDTGPVKSRSLARINET